MRLSDALEKFTIQWQADGRSPLTVDQYQRHIHLFERWLLNSRLSTQLSEIDHEAVARFLASKDARAKPDGSPKMASSVNALRASVRGFFGFVCDAGFTERNPARLVRKAACAPAPPRALSPAEQQQLLSAFSQFDDWASRRDYVLFLLLLRTGIRLGSAIAMDVEDLDSSRGAITLRKTKGNRPTVVMAPVEVVDATLRFLDGRRTGALFMTETGGRISSRQVQRRFQLWLSRAGITRKATPHALRHSFATDMYRETKDLLAVKAAMRHKSVGSTFIYTQIG